MGIGLVNPETVATKAPAIEKNPAIPSYSLYPANLITLDDTN
jgi:hypothetical protein